MMNQTKLNFYRKESDIVISKEYFINYLFYLKDKIDLVYQYEINKSINKFIDKINKGGNFNE